LFFKPDLFEFIVKNLLNATENVDFDKTDAKLINRVVLHI